MKKLFVAIVAITLISCQKSTIGVLVKDTWAGNYVMDTVQATSKAEAERVRYDCPGDRKWKADTVLPYNHGEPQAVATTWQEIHPELMQFIDKYVVEVSPGYWQRLYFIYDHKKTN